MNRVAFLIFLLITTLLYAATIPDLAFQDDAIKNIDFTRFIADEFVDYSHIPAATTLDYSADSISFAFAGEEAKRNRIVRNFLEKDYQGVIDRYLANIDNFNIYKEETELLYALSVHKSGMTWGLGLLLDACVNGVEFKSAACDSYMDILWKDFRYADIVSAGKEIKKPFPEHAFAIFMLACMQEGDFAIARQALEENPSLIMKNANFDDFRAAVEYSSANYQAVRALIPYTSDEATFLTADALTNLRLYHRAEAFYPKLSSVQVSYLEAKRAILRGQTPELAPITDDKLRLDLLNFYAHYAYPRMNPAFLHEFHFANNDYPAYYEALQLMSQKRYQEAVELFSTVNHPAELADKAKFYRGIARVYTDPDGAEADIANTINYSQDPAEVAAARFMMAHAYYARGQADEAMQLLDGCEEAYCREFRGEIDLNRGRYKDAVADVVDLDTLKGHAIAGEAYFLLEDYDAVRREISLTQGSPVEMQRLEMIVAFREGDMPSAIKILTNNRDHRPILYDGVRELMMIGDEKLALSLLRDEAELSPEMEIIKANLLAHAGDIDKAKAIYDKLIDDDLALYSAYDGLMHLSDNPKNALSQLIYALDRLKEKGDFADKDLLLSEMATEAARLKESVSLTQIVNLAFPTYQDSEHAGEFYAARAWLFYSTERYQECAMDLEAALSLNPELAGRLQYLQEQCM